MIETTILVIVSLIIGSLTVALLWLRHLLAQWHRKIAHIENLSLEYQSHLKKQAESNNAMVAKFVEMGDKVASHDMMLKGGIRR